MSRAPRALALALALPLVAVAVVFSPAAGQATSPAPVVAIPADRLVPTIGPGLVSVELAGTPGARQVWWMVNLGWAHRPLSLSVPGSMVRLDPVRDATTLHLGAEFGVWRGLSFQTIWPIVLYQAGDRLRGTGLDETPLAATVSGDFIIRMRAAFVGDSRQPGLHLGASLELSVPFDGRDHFQGRPKPSFAIRIHGDFRHRWFAVAAQLGYRLLAEQTFFDRTFGDELGWGVGGVVMLWTGARVRLSLVIEFAGVAGGGRAAKPAELNAALRLGWGALLFDLGAGGGLNDEPTAARARLFLTIRGRSGGALPSAW